MIYQYLPEFKIKISIRNTESKFRTHSENPSHLQTVNTINFR